ncbi:MAG TPA: hypothetical protein VLE96_00795 [Chlamydiales bacterium]|nr:hypothetical protein [Chlamydiales bacterium]
MKKYTRAMPYLSWIKERVLLNQKGSSKKTYHIVLDTTNWEGSYKVGDSIAILPSNDSQEVDAILQKMKCTGNEQLTDPRQNDQLSIREFLTKRVNLSRTRAKDTSLFESVESLRVADLVHIVMPLLPRFYSITNSPLVFPNEIHLLVSYVQYHLNGQMKFGVGSHFLCDFAESVPIYVQPSNHFALPMDPATSMIMVGPGTGVAPFRAFMQERIAMQAKGKHWLFFGERNRHTDFYYEAYWTELEKQDRLHLTTAFSRDQAGKEYVQHKMLEHKKELWKWICDGAFLYVCGDANEMAKEVDASLQQIVREEGHYSDEDAMHYIKKMRHERRYLLDVY